MHSRMKYISFYIVINYFTFQKKSLYFKQIRQLHPSVQPNKIILDE
jgi:hypothetical protein